MKASTAPPDGDFTLPDPLVETELFGPERGAYTGADTARAGHIELALASTRLAFHGPGQAPGRRRKSPLESLGSGAQPRRSAAARTAANPGRAGNWFTFLVR
jgi:hypothetical protein